METKDQEEMRAMVATLANGGEVTAARVTALEAKLAALESNIEAKLAALESNIDELDVKVIMLDTKQHARSLENTNLRNELKMLAFSARQAAFSTLRASRITPFSVESRHNDQLTEERDRLRAENEKLRNRLSELNQSMAWAATKDKSQVECPNCGPSVSKENEK